MSPRLLASVALSACVALFALGAATAFAADLERLEATVSTPTHPESREIRVLRKDGVDHLDAEEIAFLVRAARTFRADLGVMELRVGDHRVVIRAGSPFAALDDATRNLGAPVLWFEGRLAPPISLLTDVLDPLVPERVAWDRESLALRFDSSAPNVTSVTFHTDSGRTRIEVKTTRELPALIEEAFGKSRRIVLRIPGGVLDPDLVGSLPGVGLVESVQASQSTDLAKLEFRLGPAADAFDGVDRPSATRLVLRVREAAPAAPPDTLFDRDSDTLGSTFDDAPEGEDSPALFSSPRAIRTVVLDPGHGGSDAGGASARGEREKDLSLLIARRVREALGQRAPEIDVRFTREDDRFVPNEERRRFASQIGADLLVSIHCDSWFDGKRRGFSVATWGRPAVDPFRDLPSAAARVGEIRRDEDLLADAVSTEMDRALTIPNRGRRVAELDILEDLRMPAILIECGTLSNADDRKLLVSEGFQDRLAESIAEGILTFRESLGPVPSTPDEAVDE